MLEGKLILLKGVEFFNCYFFIAVLEGTKSIKFY